MIIKSTNRIKASFWDTLYYSILIVGIILLIFINIVGGLAFGIFGLPIISPEILFEINRFPLYLFILPGAFILVLKYFRSIFKYHYRGEFLFNIIVLSGLAISLNLYIGNLYYVFLSPTARFFQDYSSTAWAFFFRNYLSNLSRILVFNLNLNDFPADNFSFIYDLTAINLIILYLSISFAVVYLFFKSLSKKTNNYQTFIKKAKRKSPLYYFFTNYSYDTLLSLLSSFKEQEFLKIVLLQKEQSTQDGQELKKILSLNNIEVVTADVDSLAIQALMSRHRGRKKIFISAYHEDRLNIQFAFAALNAIKKNHQKAFQTYHKITNTINDFDTKNIKLSLVNLEEKKDLSTIYYDFHLPPTHPSENPSPTFSSFTFKVIDAPDGEKFFFPRILKDKTNWWVGNQETKVPVFKNGKINHFDSITISTKNDSIGDKKATIYVVSIHFLNPEYGTIPSLTFNAADCELNDAIKTLKTKLSDNTFFVNFTDPSFENHFRYEEESFGSIRFFNEHRSLSNLFIFHNPLIAFTGNKEFEKKLNINVQLFGFGKMNQAMLDRLIPAFQGPKGNHIHIDAINYLHDSSSSEVNYNQKVLTKGFYAKLGKKHPDYFPAPNLFKLNEIQKDLRNFNSLNSHLNHLFEPANTNPQLRNSFNIFDADVNLFSIALGSDPVFNLQIAFQTKALLKKKMFYMKKGQQLKSRKIYLFVYVKDSEFTIKNLQKQLDFQTNNDELPFYSSKKEADNLCKDDVVIITYGDRPIFQLFSEQQEFDFTTLAQRQNFIYSKKGYDELLFSHLFNEFGIKSNAFDERAKNQLNHLEKQALKVGEKRYSNFKDYVIKDPKVLKEYFEINDRNFHNIDNYSFDLWWKKDSTSYGDRYSSFESVLSLKNKLNLVGFDLELIKPIKDQTQPIHGQKLSKVSEQIDIYGAYMNALIENNSILNLIQQTEHNRWSAYKALNGDLPFPISKLSFPGDASNVDINLIYRGNKKTITACLTTNQGLKAFKEKMLEVYDDTYRAISTTNNLVFTINRNRLVRKLDNIIYFNDIDTMLFIHVLLEGTNFKLVKL